MICVSLPLTEFALRFRFAHCIELEKEPNSQAGDLLRPVRLTSRGVSAETLPLCRYSQPHRCRTKKPTWYSSPLSVSAPHISKSTHNTRATASAYSTSMFNGGDLRALSDLLREAEGISSDSDTEYHSSHARKSSDNKGGEDPKFKAVIKGNMRKNASESTTNASAGFSTQQNKPQNGEFDEDLDEDEKERRRMERREQRRRIKEVEEQRRQQSEEAERLRREQEDAKAEKDRIAKLRYGSSKVPPSKQIWTDEEVPEDDLEEDFVNKDNRVEPDYEILYKQSVSAEDVYLGLSGKDPSSGSCNELVVRVTMPGVKFSSIDLQVTDSKMYVTSPLHKLFLYLPHRVKSDKGTAKWNSAKSQLSVILPTVQTNDLM